MSYTEHKVNSNKNFISGWYIDTDLCNDIISSIEKKKIGLDSDTTGFRNYLGAVFARLDKTLCEQYEIIIKDLLQLYIEQYPILKTCADFTISDQPHVHDPDTLISSTKLQKYLPGNYYSSLHFERMGPRLTQGNGRELAFMTYLNDVSDGGGTDFPYQNFQSKAEQGLTLIWPAGFTHPHIGIVSMTETKYIVTGWMKFQNV